MALPANIDPSSPLIGDQITAGAAQIRDFKLFLADILGIPVSPSSISQPILNASVPGAINHAVGTGSANAHIAIFNPPFTSLVDGMEISFKPAATNTGATNFQLDALTNTVVHKKANGALVDISANDIILGERVILIYHAAGPSWILENPATAPTTTHPNTFLANQVIQHGSSPYLKIDNTIVGGTSALLTNIDATNQFSIRINESSPGVPDDAAQASWLFEFGKGSSDRFQIQRKPPGGAYSVIWAVDALGNLLNGSIPDARLTPNIPFLDGTRAFTSNVEISGTSPGIFLKETDAVGKNVFLVLDGSTLQLQQRDDAFAFVNTILAWDIASGKQTVGQTPLPILTDNVGGAVFDSADKMIAGTVPLNRVGISGSYTTGFIGVFSNPEVHTITHGLGTDNVQIFTRIARNGDSRVVGVRPDGTFSPEYDSVLSSSVSIPASGNVAIAVNALTLDVNGALVIYTILRED